MPPTTAFHKARKAAKGPKFAYKINDLWWAACDNCRITRQAAVQTKAAATKQATEHVCDLDKEL